MIKFKLLLLTLLLSFSVVAQNTTLPAGFPAFPQKKLKDLVTNHRVATHKVPKDVNKPKDNSGTFKMLEKIKEAKGTNWESLTHKTESSQRAPIDTIYVGLVPQDTLFITDTFNHNGPIFVFNDGVLIFYNAIVENRGDITVFQHGRVFGLSSSLTFPQDYFYQRGITVVQNGLAYFSNTSFNYSGLQHGLLVGDSAQVGFENVHQSDFTTAGIFGHGTVYLDGVNLGGEFILADSSTSYFNNVDTLLLWHKLPNTSVINYSFPNGNNVNAYQFDNTVPGVSGLGYSVYADSCETVWWGLMPVNGSDATISNSNIRTIGCWFEEGDTATVSAVHNNTTYSNTIMPFSDRNMHLINTYVMTWSLYVFDSSQVSINNSTLGEVGSQQTSEVNAQSFLLDGSGGYFWATDTSVTIAADALVYSTARSERNGLFILFNSSMPFSTPTSIQNSVFVSSQNDLSSDPVPFDASTMWLQKIETASIAHADSLITINGSAWIDQGPAGGLLYYQDFSLYYQLYGSGIWTPITTGNNAEIRHNALGIWNTNGLIPGTYLLRLIVTDTYTDSIESYKVVNLLPAVITDIDEKSNLYIDIFPNPANDQLYIKTKVGEKDSQLNIIDLTGKKVLQTTINEIDVINIESLSKGTYILEIKCGDNIYRKRFLKN
ncbi:MAG: secretion protein [Bacteroidetes bacterium]|jgi:hypothetical protein|nr:secretion protein [Bacteroidota bacterium]